MQKSKKLGIYLIFLSPVIVAATLFGLILNAADDTRKYTIAELTEQNQKKEQQMEITRILYEHETCTDHQIALTGETGVTCTVNLNTITDHMYDSCITDTTDESKTCTLKLDIAGELPFLKKYIDAALITLNVTSTDMLDKNKIIFYDNGIKHLVFHKISDDSFITFIDANPKNDRVITPSEPVMPAPVDRCQDTGITLVLKDNDEYICSDYMRPELFEKLTKHSQYKYNNYINDKKEKNELEPIPVSHDDDNSTSTITTTVTLKSPEIIISIPRIDNTSGIGNSTITITEAENKKDEEDKEEEEKIILPTHSNTSTTTVTIESPEIIVSIPVVNNTSGIGNSTISISMATEEKIILPTHSNTKSIPYVPVMSNTSINSTATSTETTNKDEEKEKKIILPTHSNTKPITPVPVTNSTNTNSTTATMDTEDEDDIQPPPPQDDQ